MAFSAYQGSPDPRDILVAITRAIRYLQLSIKIMHKLIDFYMLHFIFIYIHESEIIVCPKPKVADCPKGRWSICRMPYGSTYCGHFAQMCYEVLGRFIFNGQKKNSVLVRMVINMAVWFNSVPVQYKSMAEIQSCSSVYIRVTERRGELHSVDFM